MAEDKKTETLLVFIGGLTIMRCDGTVVDPLPFMASGGIRYTIPVENEKTLLGIETAYSDHEPEMEASLEPLKDDLLTLGKLKLLAVDPSANDENEAVENVLDETPTPARERRKERRKKSKR